MMAEVGMVCGRDVAILLEHESSHFIALYKAGADVADSVVQNLYALTRRSANF